MLCGIKSIAALDFDREPETVEGIVGRAESYVTVGYGETARIYPGLDRCAAGVELFSGLGIKSIEDGIMLFRTSVQDEENITDDGRLQGMGHR